ncbi:uncharacterized protein [Physcomitrium patens]|uniref:Symplekin/Pta1 N-terminal domain-containing protein n=1 Tax=Physcomitrium patens TaxID=3218 RepID=A0A2K1JPI8_PHYPA|nr:hypothetical protein PHYPA_015828 [Physcomitrium patens]
MGEIREKALVLLNEAKMQVKSTDRADVLNRMMELVLHEDPVSLLPEFVPYLLEFQADPDSPVRENVAKMIEGVGLHHIDYVHVVAPALLMLLQDTSPAVVKRAITSGSSIFLNVFEQVALQGVERELVEQDLLECWNWMDRFKEAVFSLASQPGDDEVRVLALKFVEATVLLFTPNSKSLSADLLTSDGTNEESLVTCLDGGHSVLNASILKQEASKSLGLLLNQLQTSEAPPLSCLVALSIMNSLAGLAERRPSMSPAILSVLLSLVPNFDLSLGSHSENFIHELNNACVDILKSDQPCVLSWREQLVAALRPMNAEAKRDQTIKEPGIPSSVSTSSDVKVTGSSFVSRTALKPRNSSATVTAPLRPASPLTRIRTSSTSTTVTAPPRNPSPGRQLRMPSAAAPVTGPPRTASPLKQTRTPSNSTSNVAAPPRTASPARQIRSSSAATGDKGPPRTASPARQSRTSSTSATVTAPPRTASPSRQPKTSSAVTSVTASLRPASPSRQTVKTPGSLPQNGLSSAKGLRGTSPARPRSGGVDSGVTKVSPRASTGVEDPKSSTVAVSSSSTSTRTSAKPALTSLKVSPRPSPSSSPRAVPNVENPRSSGVIVPFPLTVVKSLPKPSATSVKVSPRPPSPSMKSAPRSASPAAKSSARPASPSVKSAPRAASPSSRVTAGASPRTTTGSVTSRPASPSPAARKGVASSGNLLPSPSPRASENKSSQISTPNVSVSVPDSSKVGSINGKPSLSNHLPAASSSLAAPGRSKASPSAIPSLKTKVGSLLPSIRKSSQSPSCESSHNLSSSRSDPNPDASTESVTRSVVQEVPTQRLRIASFKRNGSGPSKATEIVSPEVIPANPITMNTKKRCGWITSQSDEVHIAYHDNEWGIPIYDDKLLFELIVLQGAQAELSWPTILARRNNFRAAFANFDPAIVAKFDEKKKLSLIADSSICFPEAKVRGAVDNASHVLKIIEDYGSLSKFLWSYVNHKPISSQYKLAKQVPVKTPKSEALSKELLRRGFRFVGPTTMYSVMQAAGLVCDHIVTCYKYQETSAENSPVTDLVMEGEKATDPWQRISLPADVYSLEFRRASANASDPVWAELPIIEEAKEEELEKNSEDEELNDDISSSSKSGIPVC